jgi:hypothetical protein
MNIFCAYCEQVIPTRPREGPKRHSKRKCCSRACGAAWARYRLMNEPQHVDARERLAALCRKVPASVRDGGVMKSRAWIDAVRRCSGALKRGSAATCTRLADMLREAAR